MPDLQPTITRAQVFGPSRFPLRLMRVRSHSDTHVHRHEFSELVVVLRGTCVHRSPAGDFPIATGDVFVLHGEETHGYVNTEDLDLVNVLFDLAALGVPRADLVNLPGFHILFSLEPLYRARDSFRSRLRLPPEVLREMGRRIDHLEREQNGRRPGWQFALTAQFMSLLCELSRCYSDVDSPAVEPLQRLGRVIGHLEENFRSKVPLDDLAHVGSMSKRTLTRVFRDAMGCSPLQYQLRLRIRRAVDLLQDGNCTVTEVATAVGFDDSNYFSRQFRQVMKCSPRAVLRNAPGN